MKPWENTESVNMNSEKKKLENSSEKKMAYNKWLAIKDINDHDAYARLNGIMKWEVNKVKNIMWNEACARVDR